MLSTKITVFFIIVFFSALDKGQLCSATSNEKCRHIYMMINQQAEILGITRNPFGSPFFKEKAKVHLLINGASCERGITPICKKKTKNKKKKPCRSKLQRDLTKNSVY